jgi:hypothetical protein
MCTRNHALFDPARLSRADLEMRPRKVDASAPETSRITSSLPRVPFQFPARERETGLVCVLHGNAIEIVSRVVAARGETGGRKNYSADSDVMERTGGGAARGRAEAAAAAAVAAVTCAKDGK